MNRQVMIVGGGPAGMAAALTAAEAGAAVTLLERRPKPGKKLLATGNGRCNLANRGANAYYGDPAFAERVLETCPPEQILRKLEAWGLPLYTDREGRVYPATQQASSVLSMFLARLSEFGVRVLTGADVRIATHHANGYSLALEDGHSIGADRLILATGGLAGGGLGNRSEDYLLAVNLGHHLIPLFGALAPLEVSLGRLKRLSGLRIPVRLSLQCDCSVIAETAGEALFTDYGLSGICVMQLARDVQRCLNRGLQPELIADMSPVFLPENRAYVRNPAPVDDPLERTLSILSQREHRFGRHGMLTGLLPDALAAVCPTGDIHETARFLTALTLKVTGVRPMQQAQITCGGIDTAEIDPRTMESRLIPSLYMAGEMVNVDGDCGGYNLQFALACGMIAGKSAAFGCG